MSVSEAAAALRNSPSGYYVALQFGYPSAEEFAAWLESHAAEALVQRLAPKIIGRLEKLPDEAEQRLRNATDELVSAITVSVRPVPADIGRQIVAALREYGWPPA